MGEPYCETDTASHVFDTGEEVECEKCGETGQLRKYRGGSRAVVHGLEHKNVNGIDISQYESICFFPQDGSLTRNLEEK